MIIGCRSQANSFIIKQYWLDANCTDYPMSVGKFISFNQLDSNNFFIWWYDEVANSAPNHRLMLYTLGHRNRLIPDALTLIPVDPLSLTVNQTLSFPGTYGQAGVSLVYGVTFRGLMYGLKLRQGARVFYELINKNKTAADQGLSGFDQRFIKDIIDTIRGNILMVAVSSNPLDASPEKSLNWVVSRETNGTDTLVIRALTAAMPMYSGEVKLPPDTSSLLITTIAENTSFQGKKAIYIGPKYSYMVKAHVSNSVGVIPLSSFGHFNHRSYLTNELIGCPSVFCYSIEIDSIYESKVVEAAGNRNILKINSGRAQWTRELKASANVPFELPTVTKEKSPNTLDYLDPLEVNADAIFADVKSVNDPDLSTVFRGEYVTGGGGTILISASTFFFGQTVQDLDTVFFDTIRNALFGIKDATLYQQPWTTSVQGQTTMTSLNLTGLPRNIEAALSLDGNYYFFKENFYFTIVASSFGTTPVGEPISAYSRTASDQGFFRTIDSNGVQLCDYSQYGYTAKEHDDEMDKYNPSISRTTTQPPVQTTSDGNTNSSSTSGSNGTSSSESKQRASNTSTKKDLAVLWIILAIFGVVCIVAMVLVVFAVRNKKKKEIELAKESRRKLERQDRLDREQNIPRPRSFMKIQSHRSSLRGARSDELMQELTFRMDRKSLTGSDVQSESGRKSIGGRSSGGRSSGGRSSGGRSKGGRRRDDSDKQSSTGSQGSRSSSRKSNIQRFRSTVPSMLLESPDSIQEYNPSSNENIASMLQVGSNESVKTTSSNG